MSSSSVLGFRPLADLIDTAALDAPARQAIEIGQAIAFDDLLLIPDVEAIALAANGSTLPQTVRLVWPIDGDDLDGRVVHIFRRLAT